VNGTGATVLSCQFGTIFTDPAVLASLADEASADCRPRQVLAQGVQANIDHASIALAARALGAAG
jgi:hypothetical protein